MSEHKLSTNVEIKDFFHNVAKCSIEDFLNGFDDEENSFERISYTTATIDLGDKIFLAVIDTENSNITKNNITIERCDNVYILQHQKWAEHDEEIVVPENSFLGRRCAIIMTIAQCLSFHDKLNSDIDNKRREVCYM